MDKAILLFLNKSRDDELRLFSGNLFVVVLQVNEQEQSRPFSYDLDSGTHFDCSGQKKNCKSCKGFCTPRRPE